MIILIVIISMRLLVFTCIFFKALYSALLGCGTGLQIAILLEQLLIFWNSVQRGFSSREFLSPSREHVEHTHQSKS